MENFSPNTLLWIRYATPPIVGAMIGYITNRIAIRMLFRPLHAWYILKVRVPMTPGVIPAKREQFAENMGEIVGEHLLTSEELSKGLQKEHFQKQLDDRIKKRLHALMARDLGTISAMIPAQYQLFFNLGVMGITQQLKGQVETFIRSEQCAELCDDLVDKYIAHLAEQPIEQIFPTALREQGYKALEHNFENLAANKEIIPWLDTFIKQRIYLLLQENRSLADILPESGQQFFYTLLKRHIPKLLHETDTLLSDKQIRDSIVSAVCNGIEEFIASLSSAADKLASFLPREVIAERVNNYLDEKHDSIVNWLSSPEMQEKVKDIVLSYSRQFIANPITEIVKSDDEQIITELSQALAQQITHLLQDKNVSSTLTKICRSTIEDAIDSGNASVQASANTLFDKNAMDKVSVWIKANVQTLLQSSQATEGAHNALSMLIQALLHKKIGRLDRFIPPAIVDGIASIIKDKLLTIVESDAPELVQSLGIRNIVTEKINSFDLLRLERLLLSIMEEQFKYINLFGALLGFLIGCLNLFFLGI